MIRTMSHPLLVFLAAALLSVIVSLLGKRTRRQRFAYSTYLLVTSIGAVIAGSWLMRLIE